MLLLHYSVIGFLGWVMYIVYNTFSKMSYLFCYIHIPGTLVLHNPMYLKIDHARDPSDILQMQE